MASTQDKKGKPASESEELVDKFLDAIWMERGLSANTLGAYRADLMTLWRGLDENDIAIQDAEKADLLAFIAKRVESGAKPRSTARQLSSFRRFFRYIMREGLRDLPEASRRLPPGISHVRIDPTSGLLAPAGQRDAIFEYFRSEKIPETSDTGEGPGRLGTDELIQEIF